MSIIVNPETRVDFSQTMRALARRWYLAVPVFLLVFAIAFAVTQHTPKQYESTGTVVLMEPDPKHNANPLLLFDGSLNTAASLLIQSLNSPDTVRQLQAQGGTATYTASDGALTGPYVVVTADAPTSETVQGTVGLAMRYARQELIARQKALGAPTAQYIVVKDVVTPTPPGLKHGGRTRLLGTTGVLAIAAALCAAFGAETYSRRRSRVRASG
jgi:hypothetical protein